MKITKDQLKKIIKEELEAILTEEETELEKLKKQKKDMKDSMAGIDHPGGGQDPKMQTEYDKIVDRIKELEKEK